MVDESIALYEEMYTRICEENGPADPCSRHCLELGLLADSGGDLIERSVGLQWLITYAHTYETVILEVLERGSSSEWYYGCYN
jgi:hypothetical protein